jgi:hypothetical protein
VLSADGIAAALVELVCDGGVQSDGVGSGAQGGAVGATPKAEPQAQGT